MKDISKTGVLSGMVSKDSDIVEGIGLLDEANAFIGLAKVHARNESVRAILNDFQIKMFEAGSEFAQGKPFDERNYERILAVIEELESKIKKPDCFIMLERDKSTGFLSVARAVVRRCERQAVRLYNMGKLSSNLVQWLNKLSYLMYLLILLEIQEVEGI